MRLVRWGITFGLTGWLTLVTVLAIGAQPIAQSCGEMVRMALESAGEICATVERNQICYGNLSGSLVPRNLSADLEWNTAGDTVNLADIASVTLSPMLPEAQQWGVAVMQVQASLPDVQAGQNVTMLLFGDVTVGDQATDPAAKPMQAFYFKPGLGQTECAEAPANGIMIQTPTGVGLVELTINGVNVSLGSTAILTSPPTETGSKMRITLLEGRGLIEANGVKRIIVPGSMRDLTFDDEGELVGEPSELMVYEADDFVFFDQVLDDFDVDLPELDENFEAYLESISTLDDQTLEALLEDLEVQTTEISNELENHQDPDEGENPGGSDEHGGNEDHGNEGGDDHGGGDDGSGGGEE